MPEVSRFYGISVRMHHDDPPPAHFHVRVGERAGAFTIRPLALSKGSLPARVHGLVIEWASSHENALMRNWWLARAGRRMRKIPPLG